MIEQFILLYAAYSFMYLHWAVCGASIFCTYNKHRICGASTSVFTWVEVCFTVALLKRTPLSIAEAGGPLSRQTAEQRNMWGMRIIQAVAKFI